MTDTILPWTPDLADSQDSPRVPVLDCMLPTPFAIIRVDTLEEVREHYRDGATLCISPILGFYLVVPL